MFKNWPGFVDSRRKREEAIHRAPCGATKGLWHSNGDSIWTETGGYKEIEVTNVPVWNKWAKKPEEEQQQGISEHTKIPLWWRSGCGFVPSCHYWLFYYLTEVTIISLAWAECCQCPNRSLSMSDHAVVVTRRCRRKTDEMCCQWTFCRHVQYKLFPTCQIY